jgi:hypothetical protein
MVLQPAIQNLWFPFTDVFQSQLLLCAWKSYILGDTPRVAARIFEQNFKVKCESSDSKDITWQYSFVNSSIKYMKACYFVESESF